MSIGIGLGLQLGRSGRPAQVAVSDAFTAADGTALSTYNASWVRHTLTASGVYTIDGNRVHNAFDTTARIYYRNDFTPVSADYDVEADIVLITDNDVGQAGPIGRMSEVAQTYYWMRYLSVSNAWQLTKVVAGTSSNLGSAVGQTLTAGQAYRTRLSMRGSTIAGYVDNALIASVADTAITSAGRAGIRLHGGADAVTGLHLDNWRVLQ